MTQTRRVAFIQTSNTHNTTKSGPAACPGPVMIGGVSALKGAEVCGRLAPAEFAHVRKH